MAVIQEKIEVNVPVSTAYNQWTQFESFPQFMHGVESVTQVDDTTNHWVTKIGGVEREFDTRITQQEPDRVIAWESLDSHTHSGSVTFHALPEEDGTPRTEVSVQFKWHDETFTEKAGAALGLDNLQVKKDLGRFRDFVESRGGETGGWRGHIEDEPTR